MLKEARHAGRSLLKKTLAHQAAWAASHTKNVYLAFQHCQSAGHRGGKTRSRRGPSDAVMLLIKSGTRYVDLAGYYFDRLEPDHPIRYYVKRLERFGHKVTAETNVAA